MTLSSSLDPARLAAVHAAAFDRPWTSDAFAQLLSQPGVFAISRPDGFILLRTTADEAELLTLAVAPGARRNGLGRWLATEGAKRAKAAGARRLFLEVADDNLAARRLYAVLGFQETGRRKRYYARPDAPAVDALLLRLNLTAPLPIA